MSRAGSKVWRSYGRRAFPAVVVWLLLSAPWLRAQPSDPGASLRAAADRGQLELARAVDARGDQWVLTALDADAPVATRLAAARAARWLRAPEQALEPLAALAAGRDATLAEAAAHSLRRIAERLDPIALARREVREGAMVEARRALQAVVDDTSARADVRVSAGLAVAALEQALEASG